MSRVNQAYSIVLYLSPLALVASGIGYFSNNLDFMAWGLITFWCCLGAGIRKSPRMKSATFTISIFAGVTAAMFYPASFVEVGEFPLKKLIIPLIQIIMLGMGTSMSLKDFHGVVKMPKGVIVGVLCQFTIMPVTGFMLAKAFGFPPEIAAGVILVGSSPSGLASNVMSYISKANLALSVTLTAVATLLAPIMTPLAMKLLAGQMVPINFFGMMWGITKMVIIPIIGGLIINHYGKKKARWLLDAMPTVSMIGIALIITIITANGRDSLLTIGPLLALAALIHNILGYILGYGICKGLRMEESSCRTVALEVGLQNAGMASGIALQLGKVATLGLAPALFGPLMNVTGSSLANYWRSKPTEQTEGKD